MSTTDIKVGTINAGKSATATISDVNPDKSNAKLKEFGQKLVALTSNTYQKTDRIITMNCDTETYGGEPAEPTLEISPSTIARASAVGEEKATITTNSDGKLYVRAANVNQHAYSAAYAHVWKKETGSPMLAIAGSAIVAQKIIIGVLPTENFQGKEIEFTITD